MAALRALRSYGVTVMCDTILAPPCSTAAHVMLFGKNSDRQRNEAQAVEYVPFRNHPAHTQVGCTYISIPQAARTNAVLLCRPFWMWGAEMGANEHGVVIGNEGLHAIRPAPEKQALTGMDLVRLALDRARSASDAVDVITSLLEQHGQGGNGGHLTPAYYNNGFMIADSQEAFVLETVGRDWVLEKAECIRTMSNIYSVGSEAVATTAGMRELVRQAGWGGDTAPDYARLITNPNREHLGHAGARRARSAMLLKAREGKLEAVEMMAVLRDHGSEPGGTAGKSITLCMHAAGPDREGQTVGSMVSELHRHTAVHWLTATAAPCISIFKPVFMDAGLPPTGPTPTDLFDVRTLWWRHERLHRLGLLSGLEALRREIKEERDVLEGKFTRVVRAALNGAGATERLRISEQCWQEAHEVENKWLKHVEHHRPRTDFASESAWLEMNQKAGVDALM
jgi:secernin